MSSIISQTKIVREFSKRANSYNSYSIIQNEVAKKVAKMIDGSNLNVLDLGCGSGAIYKIIQDKIKLFVGVDLAENMCMLHPKDKNVTILNTSFDDKLLYKQFDSDSFDIIVSSSALQWSCNRDLLYKNILRLSNRFVFAIFTSKTFSHLHNFCNLSPLLPSRQTLMNEAKRVFKDNIEFEILRYRLDFDNTKDLFAYIKKSGVSGGVKRLSYKEAKSLYKNYDRDFLEFEVLIISKF